MLANISPSALGQKRFLVLLASGAVIFLFALYHISGSLSSTPAFFSSTGVYGAQNSTLGFGAIYVLAETDRTWRVQGLRKAANLVGIKLTVPLRPHASDDEVRHYLAGDQSITVFNEIRAVMNYISLLDIFIASGAETALFVEDDVDFGVNIKAQMQFLSDVMLKHTGQAPPEDATGASAKAFRYPYGKDWWDLFWIGFYGIEALPQTEVVSYSDSFALPWERLTSKFNDYFERIRSEIKATGQDQPQQLVITAAPMGTYAFALTRQNAQRIVGMLRKKRVQQFDLALHIDCKGLVHRCVAPTPPLMHHHRVFGQKSIVEAGTQNDGLHDLDWWRHQHKYTYNVEWSARCNAAGAGEQLGDRWQCMPGRYDDQE